MKKSIVLACLAWSLSSCKSIPADPIADPKLIYKMDMQIQVNNRVGEGVVVAARAPKYTLKIQAPGKLDLFTGTNCHREMAQRSNGNEIEIDFVPNTKRELSGTCPIQLGGYEKERGRHSWGFVDFEDPAYTVVSTLKCNGKSTTVNGVGVCQSLAGLIQEINFSGPMIISPDEACPMPPSKDKGLTFEFPIVKGQCVYLFMDATKGSTRLHKLTTIGYESILFRDK